jgi:hypothetical protein
MRIGLETKLKRKMRRPGERGRKNVVPALEDE